MKRLLLPFIVLASAILSSCVTAVIATTSVVTPTLMSKIFPEPALELPYVDISQLRFTNLSTNKKGKAFLTCEIRYTTETPKKFNIPFVVYPMNPDGTYVKDSKDRIFGTVSYAKVSKKKPDGTVVSKIPFDMIAHDKNLNLRIVVLDPYYADTALIDTHTMQLSSHIVREILTADGRKQPQELMDRLFGTETTDGILSTKEDLCDACHGTGVCQVCNGKVFLSCLACDSKGKCRKCKGKGYLSDMKEF